MASADRWGVRVVIDDDPDEDIRWEPRSAWALFSAFDRAKPLAMSEETAREAADRANAGAHGLASYFAAPIVDAVEPGGVR